MVSSVYDAQAGGKHPLLDGPGWLIIVGLAALIGASLAPSPWRWVALAAVALLFWLPFAVRWAMALGRSVGAFRAGLRG